MKGNIASDFGTKLKSILKKRIVRKVCQSGTGN